MNLANCRGGKTGGGQGRRLRDPSWVGTERVGPRSGPQKQKPTCSTGGGARKRRVRQKKKGKETCVLRAATHKRQVASARDRKDRKISASSQNRETRAGGLAYERQLTVAGRVQAKGKKIAAGRSASLLRLARGSKQ